MNKLEKQKIKKNNKSLKPIIVKVIYEDESREDFAISLISIEQSIIGFPIEFQKLVKKIKITPFV